jgi:2-methylisocitrate lyase-like PEP mutase family enzyme
MQRVLQQQYAERFRELHHRERPLTLINAWDAASARVIEACGAAAIATTSAAMAWSLGHADGEQVPVADLIGACERICRVVQVPVSVDIERGFGGTVTEVCANVRALLDIGVVGINIEDGVDRHSGGLHATQILAARIEAIRALAWEIGIPLFINARIDSYFEQGTYSSMTADMFPGDAANALFAVRTQCGQNEERRIRPT